MVAVAYSGAARLSVAAVAQEAERLRADKELRLPRIEDLCERSAESKVQIHLTQRGSRVIF